MTWGKAESTVRLLPIRLRFALWFFAIFSVATMAVAAMSLWLVHESIEKLQANELQQRVKSVRRFLEAQWPNQEPASLQQAAIQLYDVTHGGKWLQVIDQDGNWIYRSRYIAEAQPHLALPWQADPAGKYFQFSQGASVVSALIQPISVHSRDYTVQTGLTLNKSLAILDDFRRQLMLITPVVLLLAAIASYFMSSKAMQSITAITEEASRIGKDNLHLRLNVPDTKDEVSRLSQTLNHMLGQIETGFQAMQEFTANVAHELRTPVSLIRSEVEVAAYVPRTLEEYKQSYESIQQETVRLSAVIDSMLLLARADAGAEKLVFEILEVNGFVRSVTERWTSRFNETSISFSVKTEKKNIYILADKASLRRLIDIFLDNAWRYTPQGGTIQVSVALEKNQVSVSVKDTGVGIPEEHQSHIFERFYHAGNPLHGGYRGSGLGLALARWIAERHGSAIHFVSRSGKGSCFSFKIECVMEDDASDSTEYKRDYV